MVELMKAALEIAKHNNCGLVDRVHGTRLAVIFRSKSLGKKVGKRVAEVRLRTSKDRLIQVRKPNRVKRGSTLKSDYLLIGMPCRNNEKKAEAYLIPTKDMITYCYNRYIAGKKEKRGSVAVSFNNQDTLEEFRKCHLKGEKPLSSPPVSTPLDPPGDVSVAAKPPRANIVAEISRTKFELAAKLGIEANKIKINAEF